ncbi:MAG: tyrosine-type recombinase/integrase [Eggerthellaceae bacterium]|nr:tyrosine-type recombinase/integrase [Eggerthellaceae bacterium]
MPIDGKYGNIDPEIVGAWLGSIGTTGRTAQAYEVGFRAFCRFVADSAYDFNDLEKRHVEEFRRHLKNDLGLAPATVSLYLSGVRSFYRFSANRGVEDVAKNVKGEKPSRTFSREALTVEQAKDLIASFGSPGNEKDARDLAIVSLMVHTGLRDIEVVWADRRDYTTSGGYDVIKVFGKGRAEADDLVKVSTALKGHIDGYLEFSEPLSPSDPLFASCANRNRGGRLTVQSVSRIVKGALRRIGIDDPSYTAHSLRHTAGTIGLKSGARLEDVQAMLRHADLSTTMIYAHHISRLEEAAEDAIAKALDE